MCAGEENFVNYFLKLLPRPTACSMHQILSLPRKPYHV